MLCNNYYNDYQCDSENISRFLDEIDTDSAYRCYR